ncbi:MAG: hypothetical protein ABJP82_07055 [Hyphomicrobiales bacterium]
MFFRDLVLEKASSERPTSSRLRPRAFIAGIDPSEILIGVLP